MLKIKGMREEGKPPIVAIQVCSSGEPVVLDAVIDTSAECCVFDVGLLDTLADRVDMTLAGDDGETLKLFGIKTRFASLFGAEAKLGWSAIEHLNITLNDDHTFEIRGHNFL